MESREGLRTLKRTLLSLPFSKKIPIFSPNCPTFWYYYNMLLWKWRRVCNQNRKIIQPDCNSDPWLAYWVKVLLTKLPGCLHIIFRQLAMFQAILYWLHDVYLGPKCNQERKNMKPDGTSNTNILLTGWRLYRMSYRAV